MPAPVAWIALDGAVNARSVMPGVLLRSDNLQDLSAADVDALVEEHHVEVVIDLRTTGERDAEGATRLDADPRVRVEHHSLYPESGGGTDLAANPVDTGVAQDEADFGSDPRPPDVVLGAVYARYLERRPDSILAAIRAIADADGAVLVHCAAGKDRTGTVVALALEAAGVPRERIVADYAVTGERIHAIHARLLATETYRPEIEGRDPADDVPLPGTMDTLLATLDDRHGGTTAWLTANGLTTEELTRLRQRLNP